MHAPPLDALAGRTAVLATMHHKERVIAPLLGRFLGLQVQVPPGFDSDRFGTFSREIARTGSALEAARAKIDAGFALMPKARVGLASEGSFGPHPALPLVTVGTELVLMIDREHGLELAGWHSASAPFACGQRITHLTALREFASRIGFPAQGLIVMGIADGQPTPARALFKQPDTWDALEACVGTLLAEHGEAWVETDLRAHRCPRRMRRIARASLALVRAWRSCCPACGQPGFVPGEPVRGLPCAWRLAPTALARGHRQHCRHCGHEAIRPVRRMLADPAHYDRRNP